MNKTLFKVIVTILAVMLLVNMSVLIGRAQGEKDEVIRIASELVSFEVSVRDMRGFPVRNLKAEDFTVYEDGQRQQIAHLSALETPFQLVLVIDTSISTQQQLQLMRQAARNFIAEIGARDRIAIVQFSHDVELLTDFTSDRAKLESALGLIGFYENARTGSSVYDALSLVVGKELLAKQQGRKAALILTDGVDSSSILDYQRVKEAIERSSAGFYFIELDTEKFTEDGVARGRTDPQRLNFSPKQLQKYVEVYQPKGALEHYANHWLLTPEERREVNHGLYQLARQELREIAQRTGGSVFVAKHIEDLEGQYRAVIEELRTLYSIGYYPSRTQADGKWHKIQVEVKTAGATLRHRSGYWAK
ncbi:MAG: VWA domain-containing protein [Acidobacteriota bacterium]